MARTDGPSELWVSFREYFAGRTPFYDRQLLDAVDRGVRQVVLLAAGLDARAFRLALPHDTTVFEVDSDPVLRFKQENLDRIGATPSCRRVIVPADLREDWSSALIDAGLRTDQPILWVAEGLLMYLDRIESDRLLSVITAQTRGEGSIATEYPARFPDAAIFAALTTLETDRAAAAAMASLVRSGPAEPPAEWLCRYGWSCSSTDVASEIAASRRKVPAVFTDWTRGVPVWLLSGGRRPSTSLRQVSVAERPRGRRA
ncbi:methyltransferase (TIGR00027 family) [Amycolatopsis jiangsuensis]|uniref:S-adenosyl-L-methionine-dependent methyltransferase n=2 Tax=Amycolatopsis jiangsuensis TaxID=1181879 RepID=A0A840J8A7_9PSEU|nr:methyltransferase (TIGR00027 family) [Amycolatopsis jiangsuensis]